MKLNYKRTFLVGFAFLSISAFWQLYDTIIPLIMRDTYHMGDGPAGIIMSLDNIVALFLLPLFGALSDKVGRRIPFILAGTFTAGSVSFCSSERLPSARTPKRLAVAGMSCIRPTAPLGETACASKPDSVAISACSSS